jgi:hypothetical protein
MASAVTIGLDPGTSVFQIQALILEAGLSFNVG